MKVFALVLVLVAVVYANTCTYTASDKYTTYDFTPLQSKTFEVFQDQKTYFVGAGCTAAIGCAKDSAACYTTPGRNHSVSIAKLSTAQWADSQYGVQTGAEVTFTSNTPCEGGFMKTTLTLKCAAYNGKNDYEMTIVQDGCFTSIVLSALDACSSNEYFYEDDDQTASCADLTPSKDVCNSQAGCIWCKEQCITYVSPQQWAYCGYREPPPKKDGNPFAWFWYFMAVMAIIFLLSSICTCIKHCYRRRCNKTTQTVEQLPQEEETQDQSQYPGQVPYVYYVPTSNNGQQMYVPMVPQMMVPQQQTTEETKQ